MPHNRNRNVVKSRSAVVHVLASALTVALCISGGAPAAYGHNADATNTITGLRTHSSFHYEMTRVLAVLAGFNKDEAEEIAVSCEAVDLGRFTGYKTSSEAKTGVVKNTNRFGPNGLFYHFGRRSPQYEKADSPGSAADTCVYFKNGNPNIRYKAPCTAKGPELDQIRNWAFDMDGPKPTESQLPLDASNNPVKPKTLVALGIYVHSIADTYSHEKCMIVQQYRFHKPNPFCCNADWHTKVRGDFGEGLPFTKAAADEVWKALRQYRGADGSNLPQFIEEFINKSSACLRVKFAVETFNKLTQEHTQIKCGPASKSSQGSKKQG